MHKPSAEGAPAATNSGSRAAELQGAVKGLEAVSAKIAALGLDRTRMAEILESRQALATGFMTINDLLDDSGLPPDVREEARRRLTQLRQTVSVHQAQWPVVAAREDPDAYRRSAQQAAAAAREFIDWMRRLPLEM